MTISEDAQTALRALGVGTAEAEVAAKSVALTIIEESEASDTPLEGMVYNVWGLYNDGSPKCRLTAPYDNDDLVFSGQFRVKGADAFVVRRKVITRDDFMGAVNEIRQPPAPEA
jgi:hypothetical protein